MPTYFIIASIGLCTIFKRRKYAEVQIDIPEFEKEEIDRADEINQTDENNNLLGEEAILNKYNRSNVRWLHFVVCSLAETQASVLM